MTLYERLTPLFRDIFDRDDITPTPQLSAKDVPEWDSLSHIRLMVAIEQEFSIKFSVVEIAGLKNVEELVAVIDKHCQK